MIAANDDAARLIDAVVEASNEGRSLALTGHGSKSFLYAPTGDSVLRTVDHRGIEEYRPDELVVTARAGTPLRELEQVVAEQNQIFPPDSPQFGLEGTVGGAVAAAISSPAHPWYGGIRDSLLGTQLVNGVGDCLNFGGKVIKNVAGYDVSRLLAGSCGTLGLVLSATFKLLPRPETTRTVSRECTPLDAHEVVSKLNRAPGTLTCTCFHEETLVLRFSGSSRAVDHDIERLDDFEEVEDGESFWTRLRDHRLPFFFGDDPLWCLLLKRGSYFECESDIEYLTEWNGTRVWIRNRDDLRRYRAQAVSVIPFHYIDESQVPASKYIVRLKRAFDPKNVFNPGLSR